MEWPYKNGLTFIKPNIHLIDTPMEALKEINDIIQNVIWEGITAKIHKIP